MLYSYQKIELMINKVNVIMCEIFHRSVLNKTKKTMEFLKLFEIRLLKTVTTTTTREKTNDSSKRQNRFQIHGNN